MYRLLKKTAACAAIVILLFLIYAFYISRNTVNMSPRQKILKAAYPAIMWFSGLSKKKAAVLANETAVPAVSFYSLNTTAIDGSSFDFATLKGKKVMIVNTASDCGFTDQYAELQKLYDTYKESLVILAFPANDFKEQEKGSDETIAAFCKKNYGVSFPIMSKSIVVISPAQNSVFKWLTDPAMNGWNRKAPSWNFSKYLVNEKGQLTHYFDAGVSPLSNEVTNAVEQK